MTKLEAWKAWCEQTGSKIEASEYTLTASSHGKAFSFAWEAALKAHGDNKTQDKNKP